MNSICKGFPGNLRPADVIAKTARVTLKDTVRVLVALDAVLEEAGARHRVRFVPENYSSRRAEVCRSLLE